MIALQRRREHRASTFISLFVIYFWLCWVFTAVLRLSLVTVSGGCSLVVVHALLIAVASLVAGTYSRACRLGSRGTCAQLLRCPVASSQTRDQTHVPCIGRQILNHWTSRGSPEQANVCHVNETVRKLASLKHSATCYEPSCDCR